MPRVHKVRIGVRKDRDNAPTLFWSERDPMTGRLKQLAQTFPIGTPAKDVELAANMKYIEINTDLPMMERRKQVIPWPTLRDNFIAYKKRRNISQASIDDIDNTLDLFVETVGQPNNIQFCQKLIDKFIDSRKEKVSAVTVNKDLRNLKSLIYWGKDLEYFKGRFRIMPLKTERKPIRRLTDAEVKTLITSCTDPELRLGIVIAVYTGLRRGDIWTLRREQLDVAHNRLVDVVEKKTRKISPYIYMSPICTREVKRYIDSTFGQPSDKILKSAVFPNLKWEAMKKLVKCKFHDLRRTCASTLAGKSQSGWVATQQLSHSDPKVDRESYINVEREMIEAHAKMPSADWGLVG